MDCKVLNENLRQNDLEYLVSPYVSVDEYTSKIKPDNITIAFFCNERPAAEDLVDYLERLYPIELADIEIADTLTEDNKNIVYVELERNQLFPKIMLDILDSIDFLINAEIKDWYFISMGMTEKLPVSLDAITENVRLVPMEETEQEKIEEPEEEKLKESVQYSKGNITRTYEDEGNITIDDLNNAIKKGKELNKNTLDAEVIEYNFPGCDVITVDNKVFILDSDKNIKQLGV